MPNNLHGLQCNWTHTKSRRGTIIVVLLITCIPFKAVHHKSYNAFPLPCSFPCSMLLPASFCVVSNSLACCSKAASTPTAPTQCSEQALIMISKTQRYNSSCSPSQEQQPGTEMSDWSPTLLLPSRHSHYQQFSHLTFHLLWRREGCLSASE